MILLSMIMLLEMDSFHKVVGVTDGGMVMYPDLDEKSQRFCRMRWSCFIDWDMKDRKQQFLTAVEVVESENERNCGC